MLKRQFAVLILILSLTAFGFKCGGESLATRAVQAISAIPSVVRVLFPNASPNVTQTLDVAVQAFNAFLSDRTSSNWQKARNAWNAAKPLLAQFGSARLNSIVAVVDILISQVSLPPAGPMAEAAEEKVKVEFSEARVKELEELVK